MIGGNRVEGRVRLDLDRPRQLGTQHFRCYVRRGRWSTCVSLGSGALCVRFTGVQLRPAHPLMARLEGHWSTFLLELRADTRCQNGTKNVLVQMSLREEISAVKSKIIVLKQL